jgi:hypothetical protein
MRRMTPALWSAAALLLPAAAGADTTPYTIQSIQPAAPPTYTPPVTRPSPPSTYTPQYSPAPQRAPTYDPPTRRPREEAMSPPMYQPGGPTYTVPKR